MSIVLDYRDTMVMNASHRRVVPHDGHQGRPAGAGSATDRAVHPPVAAAYWLGSEIIMLLQHLLTGAAIGMLVVLVATGLAHVLMGIMELFARFFRVIDRTSNRAIIIIAFSVPVLLFGSFALLAR